jgi:hypothetical protein
MLGGLGLQCERHLKAGAVHAHLLQRVSLDALPVSKPLVTDAATTSANNISAHEGDAA